MDERHSFYIITNQPKPKLFSVTFLRPRIHTGDKRKEQGKKIPSWMKIAVLLCTLVLWKVWLRELGWKIKSRGLLKGKVTLFREICHVLNL